MMLKIALLAVALCVAAVSATPLDDYINKPDSNYKYVDTGVVINGVDYDGYVYNMTSQEWLSPEITTRSIWWHWVVIVVPHNVKNYSKGVLWITGGTNHNGMPKALDSDLIILSSICVGTGTIGAAIWQIPNAPIGFFADPWHDMNRVEDAAVSITWYLFAQQPTKPELLIYLPMTKAAVRALDMLGEVAPKYLPANSQPITEFIVSGASKRGWTTWLTGAVDKRVVGIIPIVLDALNLHAFIHRQLSYYGRFTFVMQDYVHANITSFMDTPVFTKMCSIIDPYYYLQRLTMPKFAINALGDEFQMPDDQRFWVKDAPGIMQTLMVKNAEHAMITGIPEAIPAATAFASALLESQAVAETMPTFQWWIDNGTGTIHVIGSQEFGTINVAWADSADGVSAGRRDFRWAALNVSFCPIKIFGGCIRPIIWQTTKKYLTQHNSTYWSATMPMPDDGNWRAFIVEFKFANKWGSDNFWYSTPASVIPDTAPFKNCIGEECPTVMC